jgi:hypothetical protein
MPRVSGSFWRDANSVPIADDGLTVSKSVTFTGNNTTVAVPIFRLTGSVEVRALYGVVTTALGSAHTVAFWRLNDQTAQSAITLATGTTLSSAPVGSVITRRSLVSVALTLVTSAAGGVSDPVAATAPSYFMPFEITQKTGSVQTDIEYVYTTTNTPTTGAMTFYCRYIPLSVDAQLVAV